MKIHTEKSIGRLVAFDYRLAAIFEQYNIDFFCRGDRSISEICESKNLSTTLLILQIEGILQSENNEYDDFNSWQVDKLSDYIFKRLCIYIKRVVPQIKKQFLIVCKSEADLHPELLTIFELFTATVSELSSHLKNYEQVLSPYIANLLKHNNNSLHLDKSNPYVTPEIINYCGGKHYPETQNLLDIRILSNFYSPYDNSSEDIKILFTLLKEYEDELHMHLHLKNNILYPKISVIDSLRFIPL